MTGETQIILGSAMIALGVAVLLLFLRLKRGRAGPSALAKVVEVRRLEREATKEAETADTVAQNRAKDERERIWLRPIGFVVRLIVYAALFFLVYLYAPGDILNTPLARLTLRDIFGAIATAALVMALATALFNPSEDDEVKEAWGWIGVLIIVGGVISFALIRGPSIIASLQ
jgi:hypothetical protein